MGRRSRSGRSDGSSFSSRSSSQSSGFTKGSGISHRSTSSEVALRDDHNHALRFMRYIVGAPRGPVALRKVSNYYVEGDREWRRDDYYFVPVDFDDSISVILERQHRQNGRRSTMPSQAPRFEQRPPPFRQPAASRFPPHAQVHDEDEDEDDDEDAWVDEAPPFYAMPPSTPHPMPPQGFRPSPMPQAGRPGPPPPMPQAPRSGPPPPPPPPNMGPGAGFMNITGQGGRRHEGWIGEP